MGNIDLESASLGYGRTIVLEALSLAIPAGDFIVIGGPNGGGKSTLLKSITGLMPLLAGRRCTEGVRFGYVPQQTSADIPLPITAWEMVALGGHSRRKEGLDSRAFRHFLMECLHDCRADTIARRPFSQLSGGQRQRVLLARALASRPNALILDEPTAGVDRETQEILAERLRLANEAGATVVIVTHEPTVFHSIARRFATVTKGTLQFCSTPTP